MLTKRTQYNITMCNIWYYRVRRTVANIETLKIRFKRKRIFFLTWAKTNIIRSHRSFIGSSNWLISSTIWPFINCKSVFFSREANAQQLTVSLVELWLSKSSKLLSLLYYTPAQIIISGTMIDFQCRELSCFKVRVKNPINHLYIGAVEQK